jgi:hypothetical protein
LQLLPNIHAPGYSTISYRYSAGQALNINTDLSALPDGIYHVSLNRHLERGYRLELAFPKQPTNLHYRMNLPPPGLNEDMLKQAGQGLKIGFYCSSNRHRGGLGLWSPDQWVQFLELVRAEVGPCTFVSVGASYDEKTSEVSGRMSGRGHSVLMFIGQEIGHTLNLMLKMHYFFAFPSGLGIAADVLRVPCMMWYWGNLPAYGHMKGIFTSWADPAHLESGFSLMAPYESPEASFNLFKARGLRHVKKA